MKDGEKTVPSIRRSERQSASAGSGKTYALTSRFLALALAANDPTCIAALTFTRKSAGEFLARILRRLADAAQSAPQAEQLAHALQKLGAPPASQADFQRLLARCAGQLNRLQLGTIDAFCGAFLRAFAAEAGIFAAPEMMDEFQAKLACDAALAQAFAPFGRDAAQFDAFAEVVKAATFGREEKTIASRLADIAEEARALYADDPEASWGDTAFFGPDFAAWKWDAAAFERDRAAFEALLQTQPDGLQKALKKPLEFFRNFENESPESPAMKSLAEAFCLDGEIPAGYALKYNRKAYVLPEALCRALTGLLRAVLYRKLLDCCRASRAMQAIARGYEAAYRRNALQTGRLTFDDVPRILSDGRFQVERLLCEQRLDMRFKHWLFDEFQDTSRPQWRVFENLIDEALADGERTFFYVGDVKQSIYAWRGGDRALFDEIFKNARGRIAEGEPLDVSWRSGRHVIAAVNALFADGAAGLETVFGKHAACAFGELYRAHRLPPETAKKPQPSFARFECVKKADAAEADGSQSGANRLSKERLFDKVYEIVSGADPIAHKKSCAILVGKNDLAAELAEHLKRRAAEDGKTLPVETELEQPLAKGSMEIPAFIQLLRLLEHPRDSAAEGFLKMTPVWAGFARNFQDSFCRGAMRLMAAEGYAAFAERYAAFVETLLPDGAAFDFCRENLERLVFACAEFDRLGGGGLDRCADFLQSWHVRLGAGRETVAVMTVHKAKGLEFDMVVLPDLHTLSIDSPGGLQRLERDGFPGNVLYLPPKIICRMEPVLRENWERLRGENAFDAICKLYVAVTRPRQALYVAMSSGKEPSQMETLFWNAFTRVEGARRTDDSVQFGDERWWEEEEGAQKGALAPSAEPPALEKSALQAPVLAPPEPFSRRASSAQAQGSGARRLLGNRVHRLFAALGEFPESESPAHALDRIRSACVSGDAADAEAFAAIERCLQTPAAAACLRTPAGGRVFCEHPLCLRRGEGLLNAVVDRLTVVYDAAGHPVSASIVDFKASADPADLAAPARERQLALYRRAVCALWRLPETSVKLAVLGYGDRRVRPIG